VRTCPVDGTDMSARRPSAKYCSDRCKKRAQRGGTVVALPPAPTGPVTVRASVLADLEAAGRVDTPLGQTALVLAERLDARADTGSAIASVAKQLQATLEAATSDATLAVNPLDELRARRAQRGA
jgi:hypothetical protein